MFHLPFLPMILVQKFAGNIPTWPLFGTIHFSMYVDIAGLNGSSQFALLPFKDEHLKQFIHDVPKKVSIYYVYLSKFNWQKLWIIIMSLKVGNLLW